jgi:phospholipid/cholesterol/gamma-HCH transport system substrate-binding protein
MTDKMKNILIGLFMIASVTIIVTIILFLEPKVGDGKQTLHVRFTNIAGINIGTRVTFAGKPVGEVLHIREIEDARHHPTDESGKLYFYELTLKMDSGVKVYDSDEIAVRSIGLMGEKSIAILPKLTPGAKAIEKGIILANSTDPLENTFNQMTKVASKIDQTVTRLDGWFAQNESSLTHTINHLDGSLVEVNKAMTNVNHTEMVFALRDAVELFNQSCEAVRSSLCDDGLLQKVSSLVDTLDLAVNSFNADAAPALHNIHQITHEIASGNNNLSRLFSKDDLYLHVASLLGKAETFMNDLNHYGLLFQYDKHWQRSRMKRGNILKALDSPQEFRTYFQGEVDAVTTSLGRLSELLERANDVSEKETIVQNDAFKEQFSSLLRHSQSLTDMIKLYNESINASKQQ